jgi:hypothetical protein
VPHKLETTESLCVFGDFIWQELEGNEATEFDVFSFVHHSHAAPAEFFKDAVVRDGLADHANEC